MRKVHILLQCSFIERKVSHSFTTLGLNCQGVRFLNIRHCSFKLDGKSAGKERHFLSGSGGSFSLLVASVSGKTYGRVANEDDIDQNRSKNNNGSVGWRARLAMVFNIQYHGTCCGFFSVYCIQCFMRYHTHVQSVETKQKENKRPNLLRPVKKQKRSQRSAGTMTWYDINASLCIHEQTTLFKWGDLTENPLCCIFGQEKTRAGPAANDVQHLQNWNLRQPGKKHDWQRH